MFNYASKDKYNRAVQVVDGTKNFKKDAMELKALAEAKKEDAKADRDSLVKSVYLRLGGAIVDDPATFMGVPAPSVLAVEEKFKKGKEKEVKKARKTKKRATSKKKAA